MLTVTCVFVAGHVNFTPEYVVRLRSMCARSLPDHEFVCLTDRPHSLPTHIDTVRIPTPQGMFAWWAKVHLFDSSLGIRGRMLYLDLDTLIVGDMTSIVEYPAPFAIVPDGAPHFKPKGKWRCVKKYNSSVMVWDAGEAAYLFDEWQPSMADSLWGDQDWIGSRAPELATMPIEWFPRLSEVGREWGSQAKVLLCKKPKNLDASQRWSWFNEAWQ